MDKHVEDRRIRKTKKVLRDALIELMNEKSLESITIKDLTEKADLNRGTFYLHYHDIFDLLEQSETEMLEEINTILKRINFFLFTEYNSKNKPYPPVVELFEWFKNNLNFLKTLMGPHGNISFLEKLNVMFKSEFYKKVENKIDKKDINPLLIEFFHAHVIFGFLGVIKEWFDNDASIPPKEMALIMVKLALNDIPKNI